MPSLPGRGAGQPPFSSSCFSPQPWSQAPGAQIISAVGFRVRAVGHASGHSACALCCTGEELKAEKRSQAAGRALPRGWLLLWPRAAWASLRGPDWEPEAGCPESETPVRHLPLLPGGHSRPSGGGLGPALGVSWQWTAGLGTCSRPGLPCIPRPLLAPGQGGLWAPRSCGPETVSAGACLSITSFAGLAVKEAS